MVSSLIYTSDAKILTTWSNKDGLLLPEAAQKTTIFTKSLRAYSLPEATIVLATNWSAKGFLVVIVC